MGYKTGKVIICVPPCTRYGVPKGCKPPQTERNALHRTPAEGDGNAPEHEDGTLLWQDAHGKYFIQVRLFDSSVPMFISVFCSWPS